MTEIGKEAKVSLIADDMILYIENPKHAMRKLLILDLNNEFGKSTGYEINKQKSLAFLKFLFLFYFTLQYCIGFAIH